MAMLNSDLGRLLERSRTRRHGSSNSSNSSNNSINIDGSINSIISNDNSDHVNDNINNNSNNSIYNGRKNGNDILHVIGADPWGVGGNAQCSLAGTQLHPGPSPTSHCAAESRSLSSEFKFTCSMADDRAHDDGHAHAHGDAIMNSTTHNTNSINGSPATADIGEINASSNASIIGDMSNTNHYGECDDGKENVDHVCSSSNANSSNINTDSSRNDLSNNSNRNNKNDNNNGGDSGSTCSSVSDDKNASPTQHARNADPRSFGPNGQARYAATNGDRGSVASEINTAIGGEGVHDGKAGRGTNTEALSGECPSVESSYEEGDTSLGLEDRIGAIEMGENFGAGMDITIGRQAYHDSEELRATVESTVALVTSAQVSVKEQIANLQRQGAILAKAKATIRALSEQLHASEAERRKLVFATDELSAKVMVMEEEGAARKNPEEYSRQMSLLTLRAGTAETAKNRVLRENVVLTDTLELEKRKNGNLCAEVAFLKAALTKKSDVEAFMPNNGLKETSASISITATSQTTPAATDAPRSVACRPLCAVDLNSEGICGNGVKSPPSPAYQQLKNYQGEGFPMVKLVVPSPKTVRFTTAMSPSIVYSSPPVVSANCGFSTTTASPKNEVPVQEVVSTTSHHRSNVTSPKIESPVQQAAPPPRRFSARIAAKTSRDAVSTPHCSNAGIDTTGYYRNNATSPKTESLVQQMVPPTRRYSARIAAKASQGSIDTVRGVTTRGSQRVQDANPLSSLRVLRSTSRAVEKAAAAADQRPTTEPKVKDRRRFMRF